MLRTSGLRAGVCVSCMVVCILLSSLFPIGNIYSQEPSQTPNQTPSGSEALVCSAMPPRMASFVRMQNELINALIIQEEDPVLSVPAGAWQSGQYQVDSRLKRLRRLLQPNILEQTWRGFVGDVENKRNGVATTAIISVVKVYSTALDGVRGLASILYQSRPVIRDVKRLLEVDVLLGEKIDELGLQGYFFAPLPESVLTNLNTIADRYAGSSQIFETLNFSAGIRYDEVIGQILLWNEIHKGFLADGGTNRFLPDQHDVQTQSDQNDDAITYIFSPTYASALKEEYIPARKLQCNPVRTQLTENLQSMNEATGERAENIAQTIEDSITRLQGISLGYDTQANNEAQQAYIQREYELLRSMYGLDVQEQLGSNFVNTENSSNSASVKAGIGVASLWRTLIAKQQKDEDTILQASQDQQESIERSENNQNPALDLRAQIRDAARKQQRESRQYIRNATSTSPSLYYAAAQGDLHRDMVQAATSVMQLHEQATLQTLASQPADTGQTLATLLQEIRRAHDLVQGNDGQDNLQELLGEACELQCSNLGGTCRDTSS